MLVSDGFCFLRRYTRICVVVFFSGWGVAALLQLVWCCVCTQHHNKNTETFINVHTVNTRNRMSDMEVKVYKTAS
jgi:hypothetical protein